MVAYELATLTLRQGSLRDPARLAEALDAIHTFTEGSLLGCWTAEFGPQNRLLVMRSFPSVDALFEARQRTLRASNPFVPAAILASLELETFCPFPDLPPVRPGEFGPYYEFRTYVLKTGGLTPTMEAWAKAIPGRTALSPLITVMHAFDGMPRFVHIWSYRTLAERERIRAEAFATGVWPAPGAPSWLTENLRTELFIPTAISPLK